MMDCHYCGVEVQGVEVHVLPRGHEQPRPRVFHQRCLLDYDDRVIEVLRAIPSFIGSRPELPMIYLNEAIDAIRVLPGVVATYHTKPKNVDVMGPLTEENAPEIAEWCHGRVHPIIHGGIWLDPKSDHPKVAQRGEYVVYDPDNENSTHEGFLSVNANELHDDYGVGGVEN